MVGMKKLRRYDLYAPTKSKAKERNYSYDNAIKLVLDSLAKFSPKISGFAAKVFNENHVDHSIRPGKRDGAFCSQPLPYTCLLYSADGAAEATVEGATLRFSLAVA